ncbi:MAG TPA: hypothetical protein VM617_07255 [Thermoanaerobaculia bacterium]|nr:hypothetical protein [Thermoanaerobaculia bacterium]
MPSSRAALLLAWLPLLAAAPAAAWQPVAPSADDVLWVERDHRLPAGVFAATAGGLFHSPDAGDTWNLLDERPFDRVAASPSDPSRVYAVHREDTFVFAVYRSDDGGESFARVSTLLGGGFLIGGLVDFEVDPSDSDRIYASLRTRPLELSFDIFNDVFRSTDGGATWTSIRWLPQQSGTGVGDFAVAATDAARVYAATPVGLDRSDDGGDSWITVRGGGWSRVAVDPLDEDHVFAAGSGELWETPDGGASWTRTGAGLPEVPLGDLRFDPIDRSTLYAVVDEGVFGDAARVFASHDGGASWQPVDEAPAGPVGPLAVTATSPRHLLAVVDRGLERTTSALALCPERPTALCLDDDRFLVEVAWEDFQGGRGSGFARPLTADAGTFWFFEPDNVELAVKVLDARTVNGHWWVFFGALTNVELDLRVTDLVGGGSRLYHNPSGQFASRGDTAAFPAGAASSATGTAPAWFLALPARGTAAAGSCTADTSALCLLDRFRVTVDWQDPTGHGGLGQARALTTKTGWFWFFDPDNPEIFVKVLDGRSVNGHWWVFYGSLTDVAFDLVVEDTLTGADATYRHAGGTFASRGDTTALP